MLDSPQERNALLLTLIEHHGRLIARQAARRGDGTEDDLHDLLLKLLTSSPDLLVPELAGYEIGQIDAKVEDIRAKLKKAKSPARKTELYGQLRKLHRERDQMTAKPWIRAVLNRMAIDRWRVEARRLEILIERAPELAERYSALTGQSAEWVVMRKFEDEDIRRRIGTLPPKLAQVAALLYAGYAYREIADLLGVKEPAVRQRAKSIRSPKIRAALGLEAR